MPVRNRLVVNQHPQVRQLEAIVERAERFAVLLADRQRARLFVFQLGELVEWSERFDRLPRHEDDGGEMVKDKVRDHVDSATQHHLRHTAEAAFEVFQESAFDRVVIGATAGIAGDLERCLHPYLRERIAAHVSIAVGAREEEVREAAVAAEEEVLRGREAADVERLRAAPEPATVPSSVSTVFSAPLSNAESRRCSSPMATRRRDGAARRATSWPAGGPPARCAPRMEQVDDVVEEAVQEALNQSCRLEVCRGNADLDVLGRIGALLRF